MIPGPNDPRWSRILQGDSDLSAATLATKFLITRLRRELRNSPASLNAKIDELLAYFHKTPFAVKDIALL